MGGDALMIHFKAWPKIPRLENEQYYITEKIDGTNAAIVITEEGEIGAQSRKQVITPDQDNYGFATWVEKNKEELLKLGPGYHFGEWWGLGIQRGYGLSEKRFSLFEFYREDVPSIIHRVPLVAATLEQALGRLKEEGSIAAPGYNRPEGLILISKHYKSMYKVIIDK